MNEHYYNFESDHEFMEWLGVNEPNWDCEYGGTLQRLYSAFRAGRAAAIQTGAGVYEATVLGNSPDVYLRCSGDKDERPR